MATSLIYSAVLVLGISSLGESYSKYGRTCKDIGCASYEKCVMKEDPCSYYQRDSCGMYPTCERVSSSSQRTCSGYVCPPGLKCVMDGSHPRCVKDETAGRQVGYDTQNLNNLNTGSNNNAPSAPLPPGYHPQPSGTTPRSHVGQPNYNQAGGYAGGAIGSGYPGQPARPGSYPTQHNQGGYPGYTGQGQGYLNPGGYPNNAYGGYPSNNQGQGGYNPYGAQNNYYGNQNGYRPGYSGYGYNGASTSDGFSDSLKQLGTELLRNVFNRLANGNTPPNNNYNTAYRNYYQ